MSFLTFDRIVPADADTATIGIVRADTSEEVVAPGAVMAHVGTGRYSYTLDSAEPGVVYRATYTLTTNGTPAVTTEDKRALTTEEQLRNQLASPASVTVDGMSVTNRSVNDQIAVEEYLASQKRRAAYPFGRRVKFLPPGAV